MKEELYHLSLDKYDKNIIINALCNLRNEQIKEERPTDPVDDLIIKISEATPKKAKVLKCKYYEER